MSRISVRYLLILMARHGRWQVVELNKTGDAASAPDQLQLPESCQGPKQLAQLSLTHSVAKVAHKQSVTWRVVLGIAHCTRK